MRKIAIGALLAVLAVCPVSRADDAAAKAIIEKAIKATGGAEKLEQKKGARTASKGTLDVNGMTLDIVTEAVMMSPDKFKSTVTLDIAGMKIAIVQVYDGKNFWININGTTMALDQKEALSTLREVLHGSFVEGLVPLLKDKGYKLSTLGEIKVNDKPAVGVKVEKKGYKDANLYFDKASGLLVKREGVTFGQNLEEVAMESIYSDHKEFDGIKTPTKLVTYQQGKKYLEAEVTSVKILDKVDDSEFAKP